MTMLLANLGRIEGKVADLGREAGSLKEFWVSPPTAEASCAMTTVTLRGRLHVALRYDRKRFSDRAAGDFTANFMATLMKLGRGNGE
jgi:hypothetical protein